MFLRSDGKRGEALEDNGVKGVGILDAAKLTSASLD